MLRLLLVCLALLVVLYGVKVGLLMLAAPVDSAAADDSSLDSKDDDVNDPLADGGNASDAYTNAFRSLRHEDLTPAFDHLTRCVEELEGAPAGSSGRARRAACQTALAELYLSGAAGYAPNTSAAVALFDDAAAEGDADAQFNLGALYGSVHEAGEDAREREALAVLHMYAASTAGHPGALMAMGYRHVHGYGVPKSCTTAALNYIDVAKRIASVYSAGMPQAVELIRLNLHQKDNKVISSSEMNLFVQIATSGDTTVAAAIGKRYLLGIEGFRQDYKKAKHYLRLAANRNHAGALALLGYMYCLGLGTQLNLDTAYSYFVSASTQNDPLGHNGLGFIYFKGTAAQSRNMRLAFRHFNESAFGGSSDGMFNLASMYLTGTGTDQSFQKAVLYYTQALDRGHTPAAYSLAVMHLNGIGTVRDCDIAVNLLKKVAERGEWVSSKLVDAYAFGEKQPDRAALLFLKLAEAGHEVAQMNVAHLLDSGQSTILYPGTPPTIPVDAEGKPGQLAEAARDHGRILAQRFYEVSAEQGSASSELRLGDYAYYGWGIAAAYDEDEDDHDTSGLPGDEPDFEVRMQPIDYEASLMRYRTTAEMTVTGEWMQSFVARGSFNLGYMYQFGLGVTQDLNIAKQHYHRCREVDPSGLHTPVTMVLLLLGSHMLYTNLPNWDTILERLSEDMRTHILLLHLVAIISMLVLRIYFSRTTVPQVVRRPSASATPIRPQSPPAAAAPQQQQQQQQQEQQQQPAAAAPADMF